MAVAKVVTIIGNSTESFAKAADAAVQEAAKTIRDITGADVVSMSLGNPERTDCSDPMAQATEELAQSNENTLFVIAAGSAWALVVLLRQIHPATSTDA